MDYKAESDYWNERVLNWNVSRKVSSDFDTETPFNTPLDSPFNTPFNTPLDSPLDTPLENPPPQPLFLEINDYLLKESLDKIKERIEEFCVKLNISFEFTNIGTYAYKCKYKENDFRINLFTSIDGGFIIQIQRWSDDGLGFLHIADLFRKLLNEWI